MSMVFSRPPVVSFSQPKNLSQQLCRAKLQVPQKEAIQSKICQDNRCQLCTAFVSASCITSTSNGRTFYCHNQGTNCNTKWAVYVIMCDVCGLQYVGQTNNIRLRLNGHKSDYRKFLNENFSKSDTSSLYSHLKSHDVNIEYSVEHFSSLKESRRIENEPLQPWLFSKKCSCTLRKGIYTDFARENRRNF